MEEESVKEQIARRWKASADQVTQTAEAVRTKALGIANDGAAIERRKKRLGRQGLRLEGIVREDDSVWLHFLARGLDAARATARVVEVRRREPLCPCGTGVLISSRLLLTNNHVIEDADQAAAMGAQFRYEYDEEGRGREGDLRRLDPEACFVTDFDLDCTVVAVTDRDGKAAGDEYGFVPLIGVTGKALLAEAMNVIHHPRGEYKRVSIRDNRLVAKDDDFVRYTSDTDYGSSGAPVFNDQWELVALHHGGVELRDEQGLPLTRTGAVWSEEMGAETVAYVANEGARVSRICQWLRKAELDPPMRVLVDEALALGEDAER